MLFFTETIAYSGRDRSFRKKTAQEKGALSMA